MKTYPKRIMHLYLILLFETSSSIRGLIVAIGMHHKGKLQHRLDACVQLRNRYLATFFDEKNSEIMEKSS